MRLVNEMGPVHGRGKKVDVSAVLKLLRDNCMEAVDKFRDTGECLSRGMKDKGTYYVIDPKTGSRESAFTANYYTIILDGDKRWAKYPKRSKSIVCTTSSKKASNYGKQYWVFPYDNSNCGICPAADIWESFDNTAPASMMLGEINRSITDLAKYFEKRLPTDYKGFTKAIKEISNMCEEDYQEFGGFGFPMELERVRLFSYWARRHNGSFYDYYMDIFDPRGNGFAHSNNIGTTLNLAGSYNEVWTDGMCVLVDKQDNLKYNDI